MADAKIAIAITTDANHEGGYVNDPDDPGGATKYGITQRDASEVWPGIDVKDLTLDQAQDFYLTTHKPLEYWNTLYEGIENQDVCNKLFDMSVLFGIGVSKHADDIHEGAVNCLQNALGIASDGVFGPLTLKALNAGVGVNATVFIAMFKVELCRHVAALVNANPKLSKFQAGWLTRIRSDAAIPVPYK